MTNEEIEKQITDAISLHCDATWDGLAEAHFVWNANPQMLANELSALVRYLLWTAAHEAKLEAYEEATQNVQDFDGWVWCMCSECRAGGNSHAVDTEASKEILAAEMLELKDSLVETVSS